MTAEKIGEQGGKPDPLRKVVGNFGTPKAIREIGILANNVDPVSMGIMTGQVNIANLHERDCRAIRSEEAKGTR